MRSFFPSLKLIYDFSSSTKKTLFHRLGGEPMIFKSLELFYNKVQADPVLIKYVRNIKVNKVIEHHKRIIMVAFGGSPGITLENMKLAHKGLNISDNDFDMMKSLVQESFEQVNISNDLIKEALEGIEAFRTVVVADNIYQQLGEEPGMKKLIDFQFEKVLMDPELRLFFLTSNIDVVKAKMIIWLTNAFGGPNRSNECNLKEAHKNLEINDRHFFLMKKHLAWGFHKCGANSAIIDKALDIIEKDRNVVLGSKTSFEELGEDIGLKQIVDSMMNKAMKNPMLRPYFKANNVERIAKGFYDFMAKELGDPGKTSLNNDLKVIHSKLNLSDVHLDALQNCIEEALKEKFVDPMIIRDVLWSMERYRRKVCNISIYDLVGGDQFIAKAATVLQKKVKYHYRLAGFFKNLTDEQLTQLMKHLLTYSVGGRRAYRGRDMKNVHENLGVKDEHFNDMKHLVRETFKELGVVDSLILQVLRIYEDKKRYVVSKKILIKELYNSVNEDVLD